MADPHDPDDDNILLDLDDDDTAVEPTQPEPPAADLGE